jgi:hypothetical protein
MHPTITANLASAYIKGAPVSPSHLELRTLKDWIDSQWRNIPAPIRYTPREVTLAAAIAHYFKSGELVISVAHNEHPHLSYNENAKFRAVHDWHHIIGGADDSMQGEILTYYIAQKCAPVSIHWLLFSEIILQAATATHTGKFPPQKMVKV